MTFHKDIVSNYKSVMPHSQSLLISSFYLCSKFYWYFIICIIFFGIQFPLTTNRKTKLFGAQTKEIY